MIGRRHRPAVRLAALALLFPATTSRAALPSFTNGMPADIVVGQPDMLSNSVVSPPTANSLRNPYSVYSDGTRIYVSDTTNCRVLIYNSIPSSNNAAADVVVGRAAPRRRHARH